MAYPILIVDDEYANLNLLKRVLRDDYEVEITGDPREAKEWIGKKEFAIIISDQRMPHITGVELLTYAKEKSPNTIRILMSGYSDMQSTIDAINIARVYRYFQKPWNNQEVKKVLKEAIAEYEFLKEDLG